MAFRLTFENPFRAVGPAWSQDNAEFEATQPGIARRFLRSVNPLTGFGSALGQLHDASSEGDAIGMGEAAAQAFPAFGALRAYKTMNGLQVAPNAIKTAQRYGEAAALGTAVDVANAPPGYDTEQTQGPRNVSRLR